MPAGPRRILIFGGTFDPPHRAHAALPPQAARQLDCDLILYIPAAINPLKIDGPTASREHRLAMLLLAIADVPHAKISTIELDRDGNSGSPSYTIDTLRELRRLHPEAEFRLLIGCDQALDFHRWEDWQEILALATPAVMVRPPWDEQSFRAALNEKYSDVEAKAWHDWTLRLPRMDISATAIRRLLRQRDDDQLSHMLDPAVLRYIRSNDLYAEAPADGN